MSADETIPDVLFRNGARQNLKKKLFPFYVTLYISFIAIVVVVVVDVLFLKNVLLTY